MDSGIRSITPMDKIYQIEIEFNSGQISSHTAEEIKFHYGLGGIDIFEKGQAIPFFPGREEDVKEIRIRLVK